MQASPLSYFNSIKVRLELAPDFLTVQREQDFNSIKVRLERGVLCPALLALLISIP